MKKAFIITLSFFYLVVASGIFLNLHYCGDDLKKIALFCTNDEEGCCGSEEEENGCCNDVSSFFKIKDDHFSVKGLNILLPDFSFFSLPQTILVFSISGDYDQYKETVHDPPIDDPLYIRNRILLI